jgi:hypothetical protein
MLQQVTLVMQPCQTILELSQFSEDLQQAKVV